MVSINLIRHLDIVEGKTDSNLYVIRDLTDGV